MKELFRSLARPFALTMRAKGFTPPESLFKHLHERGPFDIQLPEDRGRLRLMSWGNRVENELFWRGWVGHEPEVMRWWARLALEARVVLDIGANTGSFAYIAKALNREATVDAFEPLAQIADMLRENGIVSGLDVSIFQVAVADQMGELPIHHPGGANAFSASLDPDFLEIETASYLVPVTTIDAHCSVRCLVPDLIRIDVEGVEGNLILGVRETLTEGNAVVVCKCTGRSEAHEAAQALLVEANYVAIDPLTGKRAALSDGHDHQNRNVLLCPASRVEELLSIG